MKKILIIVTLLFPFFASAQSGEYTVSAKFTSLKSPAKAYLTYSYGWTDQKTLDSASFINGSFRFKNKIDEPQKVTLVVIHEDGRYKGWTKEDDALTFYLEKGLISINGTDSAKTAKIKGGAVNDDFVRYNQTVLARADKFNKDVQLSVSRMTAEQRKDPNLLKGFMEQYKTITKQTDSLKYSFIKQNPNSFISLAVLQEVAGKDPDVRKIEPIFKSLSAQLKNTPTAKTFAKRLYDSGPTGIGKMAPTFTQNDVNDKPVKLTDFRGKYVLIDFWASWCGPCRAENPAVLAAYDKYKGKNFTVLGVSLDQPGKKAAWLAAIESDKLPWTQVSDLKFWNNEVAKLYEVRAIPQNFLIDPNGKIIAKNLRGEALAEKLASILK